MKAKKEMQASKHALKKAEQVKKATAKAEKAKEEFLAAKQEEKNEVEEIHGSILKQRMTSLLGNLRVGRNIRKAKVTAAQAAAAKKAAVRAAKKIAEKKPADPAFHEVNVHEVLQGLATASDNKDLKVEDMEEETVARAMQAETKRQLKKIKQRTKLQPKPASTGLLMAQQKVTVPSGKDLKRRSVHPMEKYRQAHKISHLSLKEMARIAIEGDKAAQEPVRKTKTKQDASRKDGHDMVNHATPLEHAANVRLLMRQTLEAARKEGESAADDEDEGPAIQEPMSARDLMHASLQTVDELYDDDY
jgi:hypothetical protein